MLIAALPSRGPWMRQTAEAVAQKGGRGGEREGEGEREREREGEADGEEGERSLVGVGRGDRKAEHALLYVGKRRARGWRCPERRHYGARRHPRVVTPEAPPQPFHTSDGSFTMVEAAQWFCKG